MAIVVIGTDTDVGKTVASAALLSRHRCPLETTTQGLHPHGIAYWKPLATGDAEEGLTDTQTISMLLQASLAAPSDAGGATTQHVGSWPDPDPHSDIDPNQVTIWPERHSYPWPISPHWAARRAQRPIDLPSLVQHMRALARTPTVIEGVGGLMVPLNDEGFVWADLMVQTVIPAVLVTRTSLGTLNHTLLTLEALQRRCLPLAGLLFVGDPHPDNEQTLAKLADAPVLGRLGWLKPLGPSNLKTAAQALDPDNILQPYLRPQP